MNVTSIYLRFYKKLTEEIRTTYGSGPPDPEDVAQQAFERLNQQPNPDQINNPEGFLWICARNIIISEKRAERTRRDKQADVELSFAEHDGSQFDPERTIIANKSLSLIKEVLLTMPEKRRLIFLYHRIHGMTPEAAGKKLGVSRTAAVKHIAAATLLIAQSLNRQQRQQPENETNYDRICG